MSAFKAFGAYSSLEPGQKAMIEQKRIAETHTIDEWLALLSSLSTFDKHGDSLRKLLGWTIGLTIIFGFIGAIVAESLIVAIVALVILVVAIILYRRFRKLDIPNSLRGFILPMLRLLREDMESTTPLTLNCDLTGMDKAKAGPTTELPARPTVMSAKQTIFTDPWISGATTLADGSRLDWEIVDHIRKRDVTKRTPRGKIKMKTKYKIRRQIDVKIGFPVDDYAMAIDRQTGSGNATDRMAVKEGAKRNVYKMRRIVIESDPNAILDLKQFIDPIARAYRQVALKPETGGKQS